MLRGFYFITDSSLSRRGNSADVKSALKAGVKIVQYRNKAGHTLALYQEALILRRICRGIKFLINDRIDIALAVGADGVHLGQDDLPLRVARKLLGKGKIIGITAHNLREAKVAERQGADYLGVSPIFATATKVDAGSAVGLEVLAKIKRSVRLPVVAIGGINLANAPGVIRSGADGLCAISAVVSKQNVSEEIGKFQKLWPEG